MVSKRIAINGFGRIGRLVFRIMQDRSDVEIIAINDLADVETLCHLLKYDSVHGRFSGEASVVDGSLVVNGKVIKVTSERSPENLPWSELSIDIVVESTGVFRTKEKAYTHIKAGAKKVVISAPAQGEMKTVVLGVNDSILDGNEDIVSNASCTTNCLAPMVKVLNDNFGLKSGFITTVHAFTSDQRLHDAPHSDLRRARAASLNMIPTSTGAAAAVGLVLPELAGRLDGLAIRVPVPTGSITDLTATLEREVTVDEINAAMKAASEGDMKGILQYEVDPIVSSDIVGSTFSCVYDSDLTRVSGNVVKMFGWYDNETGYATRVADLVERI
ncbi:MAG: type I glyceraldehyde-3-phosphate dehydrogenase [Bacteroidetes bacterium]|nr:MAG: type I glyceraldehyde-3-phosphate dehydrogenase [Bacteroidota bacterium]